jgi:hypothetical protein
VRKRKAAPSSASAAAAAATNGSGAGGGAGAGGAGGGGGVAPALEVVLEEVPKWGALRAALEEVSSIGGTRPYDPIPCLSGHKESLSRPYNCGGGGGGGAGGVRGGGRGQWFRSRTPSLSHLVVRKPGPCCLS